MLQEFLAGIEGHRPGHGGSILTYLAVRVGGDWILYRGQIVLKTPRKGVLLPSVETKNIRVAQCYVRDIGVDLEKVLLRASEGELLVPGGVLDIPKGDRVALWQNIIPFHGFGLQMQSRQTALYILGDNKYKYLPQPMSDWEIRSASTPYDSIKELLGHFGLDDGPDSIGLEVVAAEVAAVDFASEVSGGVSRIKMRLARGLDPEKAALGYKLIHQGNVIERATVGGRDMIWGEEGDFNIGYFELETPAASVMQCFANYDGVTQHFGWLGDLEATQNPRRTAYEAIDPSLAYISDVIERAGTKGYPSRDFEAVVSWIFWMLGFSPAYIGGATGKSEAADIVVNTPLGDMAIVECTTGHLKPDQKLTVLKSRVLSIRKKLEASAQGHLQVLGVIATSLAREHIEHEIDSARGLGICVLAKEDILELSGRSMLLPDAGNIYQVMLRNAAQT